MDGAAPASQPGDTIVRVTTSRPLASWTTEEIVAAEEVQSVAKELSRPYSPEFLADLLAEIEYRGGLDAMVDNVTEYAGQWVSLNADASGPIGFGDGQTDLQIWAACLLLGNVLWAELRNTTVGGMRTAANMPAEWWPSTGYASAYHAAVPDYTHRIDSYTSIRFSVWAYGTNDG